MTYNTTLYFNTGFNRENIPDRKELLEQAAHTTVDSVWLYQNQDLGSIRVKINFDDAYPVDYVSVGSSYYFVTNITMLNPNTAKIDLQLDAITTIGLSNLINGIMSGWCVRRSVSDDSMFANTIDEDFIPTMPLEHDIQTLSIPSNGVIAVVSTIDLNEVTKKLSDGYKNSIDSTEIDVSVPTVPVNSFEWTKITMDYDGLKVSRDLVGKRMYIVSQSYNPELLQKAVTTVWSLGLADAITGIYYLPIGNEGETPFTYQVGYHSISDPIWWISELTIFGGHFNLDKIPFKWATNVKNNKVFATRYNKYKLLSMVSGNAGEYYAGDIYDKVEAPTSPTIAINVDGSDNGTTYARPEYIRGINLSQSSQPYEIFRDAITGGEWVSANMVMNVPKGITKTLTGISQDETRNVFNGLFGGLGSLGVQNKQTPYQYAVSDSLDDAFRMETGYTQNPGVSGWGGLVKNTANAALNKRDINIRRANAIIQTPETWFPINNTLSLFFGNSYFIIRERLSDADTDKFDKYLTAYGYAVNEPLKRECFYGRVNFNYLQCENIVLGKMGNIPMRLKDLAIAQLENGVRIWHTNVVDLAFSNNPIIGGS